MRALLDLPTDVLRHAAGFIGSPDVVVACWRTPQRRTLRDGVDDAERARTFGGGLTIREAEAALRRDLPDWPRPLAVEERRLPTCREDAGRMLHDLSRCSPFPWPLPIIKNLLAYGADPNVQSDLDSGKYSAAPVHEMRLTPGMGRPAMVTQSTFLTRLIVHVDKVLKEDRGIEMLKMALDAGADVDKCAPLYYAIAANCLDELGPDHGWHKNPAVAARFEIASILIERGADMARAEQVFVNINHPDNRDNLNFLRLPDAPFLELLHAPAAHGLTRLWPNHVAAIERLRAQMAARATSS